MTEKHQVAILVLDGLVPFDLGTPNQIFGTARDETGQRKYRTRVCSPQGRPVETAGGFKVVPDHGLELLEQVDTVVVAGIHAGDPVERGTVAPDVKDALQQAHRAGKRIMSICTGAFVLAAAGLLDERPATTHWWWAERFREFFPQVKLDADVLFVDDGDVLTSAGVGAGIDLCLHVVRTDFGSEVANRAARRSVVPPWRDGGQAQYIERPLPRPADATLAATRSWAAERLDAPLSLQDLAAHANMSVRTFTRRFREETGVSPARWLLQRRVDHARALLESTDLPVEVVARRSGLGTAAGLRQHLQATIGVAPSAYRRTFRVVPETTGG
ncbi:GlxA family transcriptional regulator [Dactylosporangium matsuzakiense]|uniref:AraC family transcriptional regulator n=1 Tax=Dactylosporangium matsuzakiense TaxID=53360 RepID=A0A9W6KT37_9ACTN|nr:helix-turn-helix domain-containing protein [Dactylosporangium matsuzakiense]UWZ44766.1 DJ-1/PfpI family protein [Dactylosporangium matsuzakiense]GLL06021.1 AraC family transcriptional regulator [Dactylosporangium matsuzakiense]